MPRIAQVMRNTSQLEKCQDGDFNCHQFEEKERKRRKNSIENEKLMCRCAWLWCIINMGSIVILQNIRTHINLHTIVCATFLRSHQSSRAAGKISFPSVNKHKFLQHFTCNGTLNLQISSAFHCVLGWHCLFHMISGLFPSLSLSSLALASISVLYCLCLVGNRI